MDAQDAIVRVLAVCAAHLSAVAIWVSEVVFASDSRFARVEAHKCWQDVYVLLRLQVAVALLVVMVLNLSTCCELLIAVVCRGRVEVSEEARVGGFGLEKLAVDGDAQVNLLAVQERVVLLRAVGVALLTKVAGVIQIQVPLVPVEDEDHRHQAERVKQEPNESLGERQPHVRGQVHLVLEELREVIIVHHVGLEVCHSAV